MTNLFFDIKHENQYQDGNFRMLIDKNKSEGIKEVVIFVHNRLVRPVVREE